MDKPQLKLAKRKAKSEEAMKAIKTLEDVTNQLMEIQFALNNHEILQRNIYKTMVRNNEKSDLSINEASCDDMERYNKVLEIIWQLEVDVARARKSITDMEDRVAWINSRQYINSSLREERQRLVSDITYANERMVSHAEQIEFKKKGLVEFRKRLTALTKRANIGTITGAQMAIYTRNPIELKNKRRKLMHLQKMLRKLT